MSENGPNCVLVTQNTSLAKGPAGQPGASVSTKYYLLAVGCVGLALVLRLLLDSLWGERLPYVWFFLAVLAVARYAGTGPALLAMAAGFLLADWFFVPPRHSLLIVGAANLVNSAFFFFISLVVVVLSRGTRQAIEGEREAHLRFARLAAIVESSEDAIITKTLDGTILTWNAAAERLYGYTAAEAVGRSISMLMPPERNDDLLPLLARLARGEQLNHFETTRRARDGRLIEVSLSFSPVRDGTGRVVGASTIARDVSERRRAEREREQLVRQLQAALAEVKTLSGLLPICSHCKKIRDDQGYWNQIEMFIRARSNANFTHSICPECAQKMYPDLYPGPNPADSI